MSRRIGTACCLLLVAMLAFGVLDLPSAHAHSTTDVKTTAKSYIRSHPMHAELPPDELQALLSAALADSGLLTYDSVADAFLCRRCGAVLFTRSDIMQWARVPPTPLNLNSVRAEPVLGPGALLPIFNSPGTAGESKRPGATGYMLFDLPKATKEAPNLTPILFTATSDPSKQLFREYNSFAASCSGCSSAVGYFLSKEAVPGSGKPAVDGELDVTASPSPSPSQALAATPAPVTPRALEWEDSRLGKLFEGVCHIRHTGEWWSYEVCHGSGVAQLHLDNTGKELIRWSLGAYKPSVAAERVRAPAALYDIHRFRAGQFCDETGKGRSSKVQYKCCFRSGSAQEATSGVKGGSIKAPQKDVPVDVHQAWIASVAETAVCQYSIDMCVPALCQELPKPPTKADEAAAAAAATKDAPVSSKSLQSDVDDTSDAGGEASGSPMRFLAVITDAVIADTSDSLAWLQDHSLQMGAK